MRSPVREGRSELQVFPEIAREGRLGVWKSSATEDFHGCARYRTEEDQSAQRSDILACLD